MFDSEAFAAFLGGIGAGSVVTALLQHYLGQREKKIDALRADRRDVYVGLLQALEALELSNAVETKKRFGFWAARAQVVGSDELVSALSVLKETEPYSQARKDAFEALLKRMRIDFLE